MRQCRRLLRLTFYSMGLVCNKAPRGVFRLAFYTPYSIRYTHTMSFLQYIKDTKGELRYVAWPTRLQTIIYTILVIIISIFVALYLGLFDFIFTTGLRNTLEVLPQGSPPRSEEHTSEL